MHLTHFPKVRWIVSYSRTSWSKRDRQKISSMNHPSATSDAATAPVRSELGLPPQLGLRNHRWLPTAEWIVLTLLLAAFVGGGFVPGWRNLNSEFPNYYLAATLYHRHIPLDRIYEWTWFQRQND